MPVRSAPPLVRALPALALLGALAGCGGERASAEPLDSASVGAVLDGAALDVATAPAPHAHGTTAQVTAAQFARLRWLAGSWRGRMPDGKHFYERYAFVNDSTIAVSYFADSTFARATGADSVVLRDGRVRFCGATAVRVDDAGVDFTGATGASGFAWSLRAPGWRATLRRTGRDGRPYSVVYEMTPVAPVGG